MKILKSAAEAKKWWAGLQVICGQCHCVFELEVSDPEPVFDSSYRNEPLHRVTCPTKNCGNICFVERRQT